MTATGDDKAALGIDGDAPPVVGVPPADTSEVKARLLAIEGVGVETHDHDDAVTIVWSAGLSGVGANTGLIVAHLYRAIRLTLDGRASVASGICLERQAEFELGPQAFVSGNWHKGQWVGTDVLNVGRWLGPHSASGAAAATGVGYEFDWAQLRGPVVEAVTGAGWTYRPLQG